jgi:hypothetical protein
LITGNVETFSLAACPPFYALSYEWGTEADVHPVTVNEGFLSLRPNLITFLGSYKTVVKIYDYIWIDQICIDQRSSREKNHQVGLMSQIYIQAEEVISWLGPGFEECLGWPKTEEYDEWCTTSEHESAFHASEKDYLQSLDTPAALLQLSQASYWTRLWVQQEVVLARSVILASGQAFVPAKSWRRITQIFNDGNIGAALLIATLVKQASFTLSTAVITFVWKRCLDPRDKVYGMLGMIDADERIKIVIDYSRLVFKVYEEAAKVMCEVKTVNATVAVSRACYLGAQLELCAYDIEKFLLEL